MAALENKWEKGRRRIRIYRRDLQAKGPVHVGTGDHTSRGSLEDEEVVHVQSVRIDIARHNLEEAIIVR